MLTNLHTHTTLCDGKNTPEEVVKKAIECGFDSIGFSGHGHTEYDLRYCIQDMEAYITEINRLKEKYKGEIQVYLGVEEDAFSILNRDNFDYIIGSCHYYRVGQEYYSIDSDYESFEKCLKLYDFDSEKMAEAYYSNFCQYILSRKPDIVGHFDLITKFDEAYEQRFLHNSKYNVIAEKYMREALKSDCIFEVNTGAISRGHRTCPYPAENLLHIIKKNDGKVTVSADSHSVDALSFNFEETRAMLKDVGFQYTYVLYDGRFQKDYL